MKRSDRLAAAFGYASEKTKQLITLSTGVIVITISFTKDIVKGVVESWTLPPLFAAWICFLLSVMSGVELLDNMAERLISAPLDSEALRGHEILKGLYRQKLQFTVGLGLTLVFGLCSAYVAMFHPQ